MKRILVLFPLILLIAFPIAAQQEAQAPLDWIPADFSGYVRIDMSDPQMTLDKMNVALYIASVLQPNRAAFDQPRNYDGFFPMPSFDVEQFSFTETVMPWLDNQMIFAYRSLDAQFAAGDGDAVLILPTTDAFTSATALGSVIQKQDLVERETYRSVIIYRGDKTAFAFAPTVVLAGPVDLIHAVLDTMNGEGQALTADPIYQQVRAALPEDSAISGYLTGEAAARALGVFVSGGAAAEPILNAISESLAGLTKTPDRLLLSGALDGIGFRVEYAEPPSTNVLADVILHTTEAPEITDAAFDPTVLDLIPRSAMIVQSGADAEVVATDALHALPFLSFAGQALGAFPVVPLAGEPVATPTAQDAQAALGAFLDVMEPVLDVQADLIDKLEGSYTVALLPRPNNPMPGTNSMFDVLLIAQTDSPESAQAAQASARALLETFTAPLVEETLGEQTFSTLTEATTGEPLVRVGAVENLLIIGTGSAAQLALEAQRGDNRLTGQERWQNLSPNDRIPYVYVDVNAYYNTFQPQAGAPAQSLPVNQVGIHSQYLGDNLFELNLLVAVTL